MDFENLNFDDIKDDNKIVKITHSFGFQQNKKEITLGNSEINLNIL